MSGSGEARNVQQGVRTELRESFPGLAARAPHQPTAAIRLFCFECMGGSVADAARCESRDCFLWPHGPAGRRERRLAREAGE